MKSWPGPADGWQYTSSWNACNNAPGKASMVDFYRYIAPKMRTTIVPEANKDKAGQRGSGTGKQWLGRQVP